ncbi:hypothetical protein [Hyphomicrobium sp.]|uniref:hypothetical protein n=1 Tax=Hyphomicrobium sp. TaxID=82 RepID=UPI002E32004A|nr:hypothetical protein [Hyphomicrobium sp.]HEX2842343.1 hypothetical protein [Hyphomicrobium sp.]
MEKQLSRSLVAAIALALSAIDAVGAAADNISVETLLKGGWQVIGYAGTFENRASVILFRHPTETYLVQCGTLYDVTRTPRIVLNCYELR